MKIHELNKKNILDVNNNLNAVGHAREWIDSYPELDFEVLIVHSPFKIYKEEHSNFAEIYVVTDIVDNVLHWIYMYDFLLRYETTYEYIFIGNAFNYHINKRTGKLSQYATR